MKRNLQIFLFSILLSFGLNAQISIVENQNLEGIGTIADFNLPVKVKMTLGSTQVGQFFWKLDRTAATPADWVFSICDVNTCYAPGVETCPPSTPNTMNSGDTITFIIYLNPKATKGSSDIGFKLYSVNDVNAVFAETTLYFEIEGTTSVEDENNVANIKLYPNPTVDFFQIDNDSSVERVAVYSIVGREIFSFKHEIGQAYSVSDLSNGFYLARLFDKDGKSVKVIRFTKK
jgi:hypothetical protein